VGLSITLLMYMRDGVAGLSIIMLMYLWGSCIAYLVIIGDSFHPLLELVVGQCPPRAACLSPSPMAPDAPSLLFIRNSATAPLQRLCIINRRHPIIHLLFSKFIM
jgi:hypothetical protein